MKVDANYLKELLKDDQKLIFHLRILRDMRFIDSETFYLSDECLEFAKNLNKPSVIEKIKLLGDLGPSDIVYAAELLTKKLK